MSLLKRFGDDFVWSLKYRPSTVNDMILPDRIKNLFNTPEKIVDTGNYLFTGHRGTGKTTLASCIADNSGRSPLYINFSLDTGIDAIRDKVINFITTRSFSDGKKIIIGDEFDRLSIQAMDSLKSVIEEYSKNCNFIFITNHEMRVTPEVKSRLNEVNFNYSKEESTELKKMFFKRILEILTKENVEFEKEAVVSVIKQCFPDMRHTLNRLQETYKKDGKISQASVISTDISELDEIIEAMKSKDYTMIRQWVMNQTGDLMTFYSLMYKNIDKYFKEECYPEIIVLLADYQYKSNFSLDKQIPLCSLCVQIATEGVWR